MDDMIIDVNDFAMLEDDFIDNSGVSNAPKAQPVERQRENPRDEYEDSFEDADDLFDDEQLEEFAEEDRLEQMDDNELSTHMFDEIADDAVLTLGDASVTKRELAELVRVKQEVKDAYEMLAGFSQAMERRELENNTKVYAATLECDRQIEAIQRRMNDPLTNPSEKGNLWSQLQNLQNRKETISREASEYSKSMEDSKIKSIQQRYNVMNAEMSREVQNWREEGPKLQSFLEKSGMKMDDVHNVVSPAFARIILKAMRYEETVEASKATVKEKLKSKPQRAINSSSRSGKVSSGKRQRVLNTLNKGGHVDSATMFDFLED